MISKFWSRLTNNTNHENFVDRMEMVQSNIAQGLVSHFGCVDQFIESEDQTEQLSDPNKVTK